MSLTTEHKALDRYLRAVNDERMERLREDALRVSVPPVSAAVSGGRVSAPMRRSVPDGRYGVTYRYLCDRMTYTHREHTPADLVRFMAATFKDGALQIVKLWEVA